MTKHTLAVRPARLAIAAFLAFGSTPLLAQEAVVAPPTVATPTIVVPPPVVTAPDAAAPTTPNFAASAPVVQATPTVEENKEAAIAASQAEQAERTKAKPAAPAERSASRAMPAERSVERAAPVAAAPIAPVETPAPVTQPVAAAPVENNPTPVAQAEPAPVVSDNSALSWAMGGAALILIGLGATALVRRRRKSALAEPAIMDAPATVEPVPVPVAPVSPAPVRAAAPIVTSASEEERTLEAMVAAAPSQENPFLTPTKRRRRAKFLLAQREAAVIRPAETDPRVAVTPEPRIDRSQMVYSFGKGSGRSGFLKPRTS
jgi:hypothetical protein